MVSGIFGSRAGWVAGAAVAAFGTAGAAHAQAAEEQDYRLPPQALEQSLREVSVRSGTSVVAPAELVAGREAPSLSGRHGARSAIEALLAGSGLEVRAVGDALVLVRSEPGASVTAPAGRGVAGGSDVIVVTGSHIRGAAPTSQVIVIGREEIDASGAATVEQLMRKVPQNSQAGVNQENFLVTGTGVDSSEHGAGLNLRGLGQRATLVLLDGRRIAPSGAGSFVDVSLIPLSAVERVEILTDGASAIYGSDAVGGVVNFIMRRDFEGLETLLHAGTATRGDGDQIIAGITGGTAWGSGRGLLSYEYRHDDEIRAGDRAYTINLRPRMTILPKERRHSVLGVINQAIAPALELDLTGALARRDTERTYFLSGIDIPVGLVAQANAASVTGTLTYFLGDDWRVQASGGWSRSATEQMQTQPSGEELINHFDSIAKVVDYGVQVDGGLLALPAGDVKVAVGAHGRQESHFDFFDTRTTPAREKRAEREVRSIYGELHLPLFSRLNRRPGLERLTLTAALRFEHYDRFGGSWDPKVGLLWSPLPGLTLRGSYGTSFRAPLLSESVGLYNLFYFPASLLTVAGPPPAGIALATAGTDPDIGPERSRSWTAGLEFEPRFAPGLRVEANYYSIRFADRIALPAPTIAVIGNPAFDPIVDRSPSAERIADLIAGARQVFDISGPGFTPGGAGPEDVTVVVDNRFGNTAVTTTSGIDLLASYAFGIGRNEFVAELNANHIFSFDDRLTETAPVISALNRPFRPVDLRFRGGLAWTRDAWGVNLYVNHTDSYRDDRRPVVRPVDAFTTVDLGLFHTFGGEAPGSRPLRIAFHVENLLDEDPPLLLQDPISTAALGYDPVNASSRGRRIAFQLRKAW